MLQIVDVSIIVNVVAGTDNVKTLKINYVEDKGLAPCMLSL